VEVSHSMMYQLENGIHLPVYNMKWLHRVWWIPIVLHFLHFMELESLLPCLQESGTGFYPESDEPRSHILWYTLEYRPSMYSSVCQVFPSCSLTILFMIFLFSPCQLYPSLSLFLILSLIIISKQYRLWSSLLGHFLHSPIIPVSLSSYIFNTLFSDTSK
jgi:hypothetical protein